MASRSLWWRAAAAFLVLPGLVAYAVPVALVWRALPERGLAWPGVLPLIAGTALLAWTVREFFVAGQGTLAPWDQPRRLVSSGPYRRSRNPMYVAAGLVLLGWAILFRSWTLGLYCAVVMTAFHVRILVAEEPALARGHDRAWRQYVARTPRWIFPSRRAMLLCWLGLGVVLPLTGLLYEALAAAGAAREFLPPGRLVDVGGRSLHLLCIGEGSPVVLFEASGWGNATSAMDAREAIAARTRVCSYDRRGTGWSNAAPGAAGAAALANDLGVLQDRAPLEWPLVVVASSIGGLTAEMFTRRYPERVAGLVFLDAATSLAAARMAPRAPTITTALCGASAAAHLGLMRLLDPFAIGAGTDEARRSAALTYDASRWAGLCAMGRALPGTLLAFEAAPPLPSRVPLVVLSASSTAELVPPGLDRLVDASALRALNVEAHRQVAGWSERGTWREVPDSTHLIAESQPDAVVEAVFDVLDQLRR